MTNDKSVCSGTLLGESLRLDVPLEGIPLTVTKIYRKVAEESTPGEPEFWTLIEFSIAADRADELAGKLSDALIADGGWYCDFHTPDEVFVVFHKRIFRYDRGDLVKRAKVEEYGRSVGLPESYLDWPE